MAQGNDAPSQPPLRHSDICHPFVGPWLNIFAPIYADLIKNDLAPTKALVAKLSEIKYQESDRSFLDLGDRIDSEHLGQTRQISGAALRTLHEFLKRKDPDQVWGGLTHTVTPEGNGLWLCPKHIKELYPISSRRS